MSCLTKEKVGKETLPKEKKNEKREKKRKKEKKKKGRTSYLDTARLMLIHT